MSLYKKTFLKKTIFMAVLVVILFSCRKEDEIIEQPIKPPTDKIIRTKNEIRAAWIATVSNLDWPATLSNPDAQKSELIAMLNHDQSLNFNAVILQVRPCADAFYRSDLEPWSSYLTGTQGTDPGYDPLRFAVEEAHKRGMEFHAWLNPYRIGATSIVLAPNHVAVTNPEWMVTFNNVRYFNPGVPEVIEHLKNVVKDIISRYEVDAIHFDDYFYPSGAKSTSNPFGFNDKAAWEKYGNGADVHTWRANNVSRMIREVSQLIHATSPGVLFGISPSGRRENSLSLYADPIEWLNNKWVDYLAPQIYWEIGHATADYAQLANYWNENARGIPMVIGIAAYKFKDPAYPAYGSTDQIGRQIELVRQNPNLSGCFFFREKFLENTEMNNFLKTKYPYKSVLPAMGISTSPGPAVPVISPQGNLITWVSTLNATKYAVYLLEKDPGKINTFNARCMQVSAQTQFSPDKGKSYFVTAVNRDNAESASSNVLMIK